MTDRTATEQATHAWTAITAEHRIADALRAIGIPLATTRDGQHGTVRIQGSAASMDRLAAWIEGRA